MQTKVETLSFLKKPALMLMLLCVMLVLPACKTTRSTETTLATTRQGNSAARQAAERRNVEVRCAGQKPITYSAALDTPVTATQVRQYNDMMKRRNCTAFVKP